MSIIVFQSPIRPQTIVFIENMPQETESLTELMNIVSKVQPSSHILNNPSSPDLTYLKLNYSSINLVENTRVLAHKPGISQIVLRVKATEEK